MRGKVLSYNDLEGTGLIGGDDGQRYAFTRGDLGNGVRSVIPGTEVDFEIVEGAARNVYVTTPAYSGLGGDKNKIVAALLAFVLGWLGIHKFYLGKTTAGIIMLLCGTIGWVLLFIPPMVVGLISFIEFIIYLVKSDQQFHEDYVVGDKSWF
ncbi:NINE protein [Caulobacter sp. SLTY]|uniref:NINE protein n=1 Tax=Caulobacter sp. SLTY TaxID=2683262 RepID=UPI001412EF6C|nr:NINE protein [Caulobacter sp. SLTY]NBB17120.1 NINE protein [Caulobacter sp. SLTY]